MIIKSLSRKSRNPQGSPGTLRARRGRGHAGAARGGGIGGGGSGAEVVGTPFRRLAEYMNRDIDTGDGVAVLWHNFYGDRETATEEVIERFEANARLLRERKNGNVLYHEIVSFERGYQLDQETLARIAADIGHEYLRQRGADQLGYGVIHLDTDHCHLHLMISANRVDSPDRVRLSKAQFADVQKSVERYVREHYPELRQRVIYDKGPERGQEPPGGGTPPEPGDGRGNAASQERVRMSNREQAMHIHRGATSNKLDLAQRMHQLFERARSAEELAVLLKADNIRLYQRGKTPGLIITEPDGTERKHRLATLGLLPHYEATNARLQAVQGQGRGAASHEAASLHRASAFRETTRDARATSRIHETVPPPPPSTQHAAHRDRDRDRLSDRDPQQGVPPVNPTVAKAAQTVEQTATKAREVMAEEMRFGKEVVKDFIFSPYREDRQPNHQKPPEPKTAKASRQTRAPAAERAPETTPEASAAPTPATEPKSVREALMAELREARAQGRGQSRDRDRER